MRSNTVKTHVRSEVAACNRFSDNRPSKWEIQRGAQRPAEHPAASFLSARQPIFGDLNETLHPFKVTIDATQTQVGAR